MSNLNEAMSIISQHTREYDPHFLIARQAASDLHSAGLLIPDLPEPEDGENPATWWDGTYGIGARKLTKNGPTYVALWDSEPGGVTYVSPKSARSYALKILAAADYTEKEL